MAKPRKTDRFRRPLVGQTCHVCGRVPQQWFQVGDLLMPLCPRCLWRAKRGRDLVGPPWYEQKKLAQKRQRKAREMKKSGIPNDVVATLLGVHERTIRKWVQRGLV